MVAQGGSVRWVIEADSSNFENAVDRAGEAVDSFKNKVKEADSATKSGGVFDNLVRNAKDSVSQLEGIGNSLKKVGWGTFQAGATAATGALTSLINKGLQATDFLETSRVAMSGLTGSIEDGNRAMSIAANYWQNNPFQRIDVTQATKQLVQFGRTTGQLAGDLDILGNVSLSSGVAISELARYYARVSASGRAMTMDLEMMSDRGVPIYRELAKQLNTTQQGVRDMASSGKIDFETFRKAMEGAVDEEAMKQYGDTMARQVDRLKGSIQILAGDLAGYKIINNELVIASDGLEKTWTKLLNTLATGLRSEGMREGLEKIGKALAQLLDKILQFYETIDENGKVVQHSKTLETVFGALSKAIDFIGEHSATLIPIFGAVLALMGKIGGNIPVIGGLLQSLGNNFKSLSTNIGKLVKSHPILSAFIALFGYGLVEAMKNNEEFRNSISELMRALSRLGQTLAKTVGPILEALVNTFVDLAKSDAVQGILVFVADALTMIANALASIPIPVLTALITGLLVIKAYSVSPLMGVATGVMLVVSALKSLEDKTHIFSDFWKSLQEGFGKAVKFLSELPNTLATIGHNFVIGMINGIADGAGEAYRFVADLANNIVKVFATTLGIHSPSTVMYGMGKNVVLGLANGITDNKSAVQKGMDALATDILSLSEKVIGNKKDFGLLDPNGEYQAWKKVSKMFAQGSAQYQKALEKMEEARKQVNLKIIALQETYNDALDESIDKIKRMYGLFDKVNLSGGMGSEEILKNLDQQVAQLQRWESAQQAISGLKLDPKFIEELQDMGVDAVNELSAIAGMTSSELSTLNDLWLKKQAIANREGTRQMSEYKEDTLKEISRLKKGIDGETVDVREIGGRLVSEIGEGITGALPTLDEAFGKLNDYIAKATAELAKSGKGTGASASGLQNVEDYLPDTHKTAEGLGLKMDEIKTSVEDFAQQMAGVIAGVVGGGLILKFLGGKIKNAGGLSKVLGNVFGKGKGSVAETVKDSVSNAGKSIGSASQTMTQAPQWASNIKAGAKAVVEIAGAIVAMALAIWAAHQLLKDIDFLSFVAEMGMVAIATGAMGALAWLAQDFKIDWRGVLALVGLAVDIAAVGAAIGFAHEKMKDIDFLQFQAELIMMIEALAVMGILAFVAGAVVVASVGIAAGGILAILGLAADIAATGEAIGHAYNAMKDVEFGKFQEKLLIMIEALGAFGGLSAVMGIFTGLIALGWADVLMVCDELVKTADAIKHVDETMPEDFGKVREKIKNLKETIEYINQTDIGKVIGAIVTSWSADSVVKVMGMYVEIANAMRTLSEVSFNGERVWENLKESVKAAQWISEQNIPATDWKAKEFAIGMTSSIIWKAIELGNALQNLGDSGNLEEKKNSFEKIIEAVANVAEARIVASDWKAKEFAVGMASSIAWKLSEFGEALSHIQNAEDVNEKIINLTGSIGALLDGIQTNLNSKLDSFERLGSAVGDRFSSGLESKKDKIANAGRELQSSLWRAIEGKMNDEFQQGRAMAEKFKEGIKSVNLDDAGQAIQSSFWWAINSRMDDEYWQGVSMGERFRQGLYNVDYANSGWWAVQGFLNGAYSRAYYSGMSGVERAGYDIARTFLSGLRRGGEEGSPWKTTMESGVFAVEGLIEGLKSSERALVGEATSLAEQVVDALSLEDVAVGPTLDVRSRVAPSMVGAEMGYNRGSNVVINQQNDIHSELDMDRVSRQMSWQLSKI